MLRILLACSASTKKSLQGLDYFAEEGARAFNDLETVIEKVSLTSIGQDWMKETDALLKAGKLYLKGDYKLYNILITVFLIVLLSC